MILLAAALAGTLATTPESRLSGAWTVDLTPSPGATKYTKPMQLTLAPGGTLTGSFYDSDIQAGRWETQADRTCVSFRTTDGVGPYHSSACLDGADVVGQTWAEHRSFVFLWTATRASSGAQRPDAEPSSARR